MFFPLAEKMIEKYFENKISGSTSKISDVLNNDGGILNFFCYSCKNF
jgi:hypothetical protein